MRSRTGLVVVSGTLMALVCGSAAVVARSTGLRVEDWSLLPAWSLAAANVQSIVATTLRRGEAPTLVLEAKDGVILAAADGTVLKKRAFDGASLKMATGDVNGDGADEVVVAQGTGETTVTVLDAGLADLWSAKVPSLKEPARVLVADLDADGRAEVVVADWSKASLVGALSSAGRPLWTYRLPEVSDQDLGEVRGLDDVKVGTGRRVALARRSGDMTILDAKGKLMKQANVTKLRRLRAYDVDGDGAKEVLVGQEAGACVVFDKDGRETGRHWLLDAVTEIRTVELDGDPATIEVALGGKKGKVQAFGRGAGRFAGANVIGKVSALRGVDTNGDGREEVFVGTEEGTLIVLDHEGRMLVQQGAGGKVESIASVVSPLRDRFAVVAAGPKVTAYRLGRRQAPAWYTPPVAALVGCIVIAVVARALGRVEAAPALQVTDPAAARPARAETLEEAVAHIESLVARGLVPRAAAAERLQQLGRQIGQARGALAPAKSSPQPPPRKP